MRAGSGHSAQVDGGGACHRQIADTGNGGTPGTQHGDGCEVQCQVIAGTNDPCRCGQGCRTGTREVACACQRDGPGVALVAGGGDATPEAGGAGHGDRSCSRVGSDGGVASDLKAVDPAGHAAGEGDRGAGKVARGGSAGKCDQTGVGLGAGGGDIGPRSGGDAHRD